MGHLLDHLATEPFPEFHHPFLMAGGTEIFILALGMHIDIRLLDCVLLIPLVTMITIVPVSIAGWGLREGAMVLALGFVGVAPNAAFSISLRYGLVILVSGAPGGLIWLAAGHYEAKAVNLTGESPPR